MMVQINMDKEEAEVVRVKVEAEEATANEKVSTVGKGPKVKGKKEEGDDGPPVRCPYRQEWDSEVCCETLFERSSVG